MRGKNMKSPGRAYPLWSIKRFATISSVMMRHGFGDILDRIFAKKADNGISGLKSVSAAKTAFPSPERIRMAFEELGPAFIKLGQIFSVRADVFPQSYTEEFKKLQDQVPPVSFDEIKNVMETGLGAPLNKLFTDFDKKSIAAASVAQVHKARLKTGEKVAVKVIRPRIEKKIKEDIAIMYFLAEKMEKAFEIGRIIGAVNLVKEFEKSIFKELDMFTEAGNMERFAANFEDSDEIYIAKVYWTHTSRSVLTMEYIPGIKMDQVEEIRKAGIDPKEVAMTGLRSFSRQLMEFGFFHADPHPGNTIVMYDGRVSLVDFGIISYLDEETMLDIANIFLGYAEHDYDMVIDAFINAGIIDEEKIDLKSFRADLKDMSEPFYGRSLSTISVKDVYDQVMGLAYQYGIRLPGNLLLLLKTFVQTEALGKILGSDASLLEVTKPYAKKLLKRGYDARKAFKNFGREARIFAGYLKDMPKLTYEIVKRTAYGKHGFDLRHTGFDPAMKRMEKSINRVIMGVIISASVIAGSLVLNSPVKIMEIRIGTSKIALTYLLGMSGYTIATVLGLWLIISIFRSGKM